MATGHFKPTWKRRGSKLFSLPTYLRALSELLVARKPHREAAQKLVEISSGSFDAPKSTPRALSYRLKGG